MTSLLASRLVGLHTDIAICLASAYTVATPCLLWRSTARQLPGLGKEGCDSVTGQECIFSELAKS